MGQGVGRSKEGVSLDCICERVYRKVSIKSVFVRLYERMRVNKEREGKFVYRVYDKIRTNNFIGVFTLTRTHAVPP